MIHKARWGWPACLTWSSREQHCRQKKKINEIFLNIFSLYFPCVFHIYTLSLACVWIFHAYFSQTGALVTTCHSLTNKMRNVRSQAFVFFARNTEFTSAPKKKVFPFQTLKKKKSPSSRQTTPWAFQHVEVALIMKITNERASDASSLSSLTTK